MSVHSIGDQARAFALQAASYRLKTTLATLTDEMATGEVADLGDVCGVDEEFHAVARPPALSDAPSAAGPRLVRDLRASYSIAGEGAKPEARVRST